MRISKETRNIFSFLLPFLFFLPASADNRLFRRKEELKCKDSIFAARTQAAPWEDGRLIQRIISSYRQVEKNHLGESMWQFFYERQKNLYVIFQAGNPSEIAPILQNPGQTDLFYGFDNLCSTVVPTQITHQGLINEATLCLDSLIRLGEAVGAMRLYNPEGYDKSEAPPWSVEEILRNIEDKLLVRIPFPNPYPDEVGLYTPHGVASYRPIQAIYQAYLIKELVKNIPNPRILEIGAGLGRTAYYCRQFGIKDYTIVDIPMTSACSAYFLGTSLGADQIVLFGEDWEGSENKVKILPPKHFLEGNEHYDLIVNVDSLTEMDSKVIEAYLARIMKSTPIFLSINHEVNKHTINELLSGKENVLCHRKPYWMRQGYVEEIFTFRP